MVKAEVIEGIVDDLLRFHYDIFADVLSIRLLARETEPTIGDVTDEGDILLREERTDLPVGLTVVSWWKRFGRGVFPDSSSEISRLIEPMTKRFAA